MSHAEQVLVAGLGPARGPAEPPGHPADHGVLRVGAELGAERAAHVRGDDPERGLIDAEQVGQGLAGALRALVRDPGRQPAVRPVDRGRGPGLHRSRRDPLVDDGAGDDDLAAVEQIGRQGSGIAEGGGDVAARSREKHGRPRLGRLGHVHHRRQRVIVDIDEIGGILALVAALGHDYRYRLADVPDHVRGDQRLAHLGVDHARHHRGQLGQVHVGAGERSDHAQLGHDGADVDGDDPRVRDRRPDEVHVAGARQPQVVRVDPAGGQEARVFRPDNPGTQNTHR